MASGEVATRATGTVEAYHPPTVGPSGVSGQPLATRDLATLDDVIAAAEVATGLRFSVYLGDLGEDTRATAESLLDGLGGDADSAVLLAVSPGQRVVEVVTGRSVGRRLTERGARLAVLNVVSRAGEGDLLGALTNGVRTLADQAGILPERATW